MKELLERNLRRTLILTKSLLLQSSPQSSSDVCHFLLSVIIHVSVLLPLLSQETVSKTTESICWSAMATFQMLAVYESRKGSVGFSKHDKKFWADIAEDLNADTRKLFPKDVSTSLTTRCIRCGLVAQKILLLVIFFMLFLLSHLF